MTEQQIQEVKTILLKYSGAKMFSDKTSIGYNAVFEKMCTEMMSQICNIVFTEESK